MNSVEERVRRLVASQRALSVERVTVESRLQDDLGLEGDDAVELFKAFEKEFETDCSALWRLWDEHFAPEGGVSPLFALVLAGLFGAGFALGTFQKWLPPWIYGVALAGIWIWPLRCWPVRGRNLSPITVQNLIDAARTRRWPETHMEKIE
jgi:acyl carrier protein